MTALLKQPTPAPAPPKRRQRWPAWSLVGWTFVAIALSALANCDDLVRLAQHQPFGWQRTVTLRLAEDTRTLSHALLLDRPRRALDTLLHPARSAPAPPSGGTPAPTHTPPGTAAPTTPGTPTVAPATNRPTVGHPLRVYMGGDSVMQAISTAFARAATATRLVTTTLEYRFSTGLSRPDYFDWPKRLSAVLAQRPRPQVVAVMFGANDIQPIMTPTGPARTGTAAWLNEYRRRVAAVMAALSASGTDVYWLGQPLMRSPTFTRLIDGVDEIYASEASRHTGIRFIDTRPILADKDGHYAAYLPDASGRDVLVRTPDGVHLTDAGGSRVARALLRLIRTKWKF